MDTVHVILWVVIILNIASTVFNMLGGDSSKLTRKRFEQGTELGNIATLAAMATVIKETPEILEAFTKDPEVFNKITIESEKSIKESIKRIYK